MRWAIAFLVWAGTAQAEVNWPADADLLVLGEIHDNPDHHVLQAQIVSSVRPVAIVFEMLTPEQAAIASGMDRSDAVKLGAALDWQNSGWPDFAMYHPIFAAAPDAIVFGAALPGDLAGAAMELGVIAAFGPEAAAYGLTPLSPEVQAQQEAEQAAAHCNALPPEILPRMVDVQRMRDAHFAKAMVQAYDRFGGPVVLITGTGHARTDIGVPAALRHARPDLGVWALGQLESAQADAPFDAVNLTDPIQRPDPCLAFQ